MFPLFELQRAAKTLPAGIETFGDWLESSRARMGQIHAAPRKRAAENEDEPDPSPTRSVRAKRTRGAASK
jgi:hypothetical protein